MQDASDCADLLHRYVNRGPGELQRAQLPSSSQTLENEERERLMIFSTDRMRSSDLPDDATTNHRAQDSKLAATVWSKLRAPCQL